LKNEHSLLMAEQGYFRLPAIHAGDVFFVAEDDVWTVSDTGGVPRRLTSGLGEMGKDLADGGADDPGHPAGDVERQQVEAQQDGAGDVADDDVVGVHEHRLDAEAGRQRDAEAHEFLGDLAVEADPDGHRGPHEHQDAGHQ